MPIEQYILMIALMILAAALIWAAWRYWRFYQSEHFVCPKCSHCFKPPLLKLLFSANAVEGKIIRCPQCGEKEYMEPVKDSI